MQLDYFANTGAYTLSVPRASGAQIKDLMSGHGFDFSSKLSKTDLACLFTHESYAAASFGAFATPRAKEQLAPFLQQIEASQALTSGAHIRVPADKVLWEFQKASVAYALDRKYTLIADQPGLGKTPIAIAYANEIRAGRVLCIVPANIRGQWERRIREWSTMQWPYSVYTVYHGRNGVHPTANWTVISYDLARNPAILAALARGRYDLLIIDEAHMLKTVGTKRTRAVFGSVLFPELVHLAPHCERIMALTGTPLPNRPREAYVLARNLCLGADTQVLTNTGIKAIVDVQASDKLWDGERWVSHAGVVSKGEKEIIGGALKATADHKILFGGRWTTWRNVLEDGCIQSRALATGWESLRSLAIIQEKAEFALLCHVRAESLHIKSQRQMREVVATKNAMTVGTRPFLLSPLEGMRELALIESLENLSWAVSSTSPSDANSQTVRHMNTMAAAVSDFGLDGLRIASPSSNTSWHFPAAANPDLIWIELTTTKATSLGTCDGPQSRRICETGEALSPLPPASKNLKPVFDIVNAGPLRRFTVITDAGPLVVHNCWDCIDFASEDDFRERFNPAMRMEGERYNPETKKMESYVYTDERSGRHMELQNRLRVNFMARHLKREVMPQLKMPVFDIIQLTETSAVKQALAAERLLDIDPETLQGADLAINGQWAIVRQQMGIALAPQIADYIEMLLDGGEDKLVLAGWHHAVLDIWCERLAKYGIIRIDGNTTAKQKERLVVQFGGDPARHIAADPNIRVAIGNMQSMGQGTDGLQHVCNHILVGEPSPVPGDNEQMVDRLDRGGQDLTVQAEFFVAPNSILERILASSLRKLQITHAALDKKVRL